MGHASLQQSSVRPAVAALIVAAAVVGFGLRAWGLEQQILIDDEFHAFRAGLRSDLDASYLFSHNTLPEDRHSDFSSALALWVRALVETVGVSEWTLRAPMLLASAAVPVVLGTLGLRAVGPQVGVLAAWLAALSPLLILYARFARPYGLVVLCGAIALSAAVRFRARGSLVSALALGAATALGAWFSASALPALSALTLLGFAPALRGRQGRQARRAAAVGLGLAAGLGLALIGPSAGALAAFAQAKSAAVVAPGSAWWGAAQAAAGSPAPLVVLAFFGAVLAGGVIGIRRAPAVTMLALAATVAQLVAFAMLQPRGAEQPLVVARYAIAAFPGVLLLAATGLGAGLSQIRWREGRALGAVLAGVAWCAAGPLPDVLSRENAFTNHPETLVGAFHEIDPASVPRFYREIAAGEYRLVEAPWVLEWPLAITADYQAVHGQPVQAWSGFWTFRQPGVRLNAHVAWRGDEPDLHEIDRVVVHLDLVEEWRALTGGPATMPFERLAEAAARYRTDAAVLDRWMAAQPGWERVYEDRWLHVYAPRS